MRGAEAILAYLEAEGVRYLFGNPGTTEVPIMDALVDSDLEYVLCLQENVAVSAADGLAQATRRATVVNLHTAPGLAQAFSALYMAARHLSPVVVTAGNEYMSFGFTEPLLQADLVSLAEPLVKWAYEPRTPSDLIPALRRAFKVAQTPPRGPVFLSLPLDLQVAEVGDVDLSPASIPEGPAPDREAVRQIAKHLAEARNPCIVAGDDVGMTRALSALVRVAEQVSVTVFGAPLSLTQVFPNTHPLWGGSLSPFPSVLARLLGPHDLVLVLGARAFYLYYFQPVRVLPEGSKLMHVHPDGWELGKNYPTEVSCIATADRFLQSLEEEWKQLPGELRERASGRASELKARVPSREATESRGASGDRLRPSEVVAAAAEVAGDELTIVDESVSATTAVRHVPPLVDEDSFFGHMGGALGWGSGAALGVALGLPNRKVVAVLGDGSLLYSPQAVWTAARYRIPVLFLILNNAGYAIIKAGTRALKGRAAEEGRYIGMDLIDPEIGFTSLAEAFGVPGERVATRESLVAALEKAFSSGGPYLIDVIVDRTIPELPK
jgi:benzoylformate decarboxylase